MRFFKQTTDDSCQINAIQTVLSYYGKDLSHKELMQALPKHSFGNFITELGLFLETQGLSTTLLSNQNNSNIPINAAFLQSLSAYKKAGKFIDMVPNEALIKDTPILVNVDWYKIKNKSKPPEAHYVVLLKKHTDLWLFDGSNYNKPVKTSFDHILSASTKINKKRDNGMWLYV